jgi:hypothetical protein
MGMAHTSSPTGSFSCKENDARAPSIGFYQICSERASVRKSNQFPAERWLTVMYSTHALCCHQMARQCDETVVLQRVSPHDSARLCLWCHSN